MRFKTFGKTKESVSVIGHGTWTMGSMWGPRDDREAIESLKKSLACGVSFIDTAWVYGEGHSESLIASAFRESKQKAFVATKIPPKNHHWPARHNLPISDYFPHDHVIEYTEKSLKSLRSDCIDLQQFHVWSDSWMENLDWLEAINTLKNQGKIKHFGVSVNDHEPNSVLKLVDSGLIDSVQVIFNIFDQSPLEKLFPLCLKKNVAVIARVPFDEGSLTGTLTYDTVFHKKDWRKVYFKGDRLQETVDHVEALKKDFPDIPLPELALRFCLSHKAVTTVIPGMRRLSHVEQNTKTADLPVLTSDELTRLLKHAWKKNFYPTYGE